MAFAAACRPDAGRLDHGGGLGWLPLCWSLRSLARPCCPERVLSRYCQWPATVNITASRCRACVPSHYNHSEGAWDHRRPLLVPHPKCREKGGRLPAITFHHPIRLSSTRDYNGLINAPLKDVGDVRGSGGAPSEVRFQCPPLT